MPMKAIWLAGLAASAGVDSDRRARARKAAEQGGLQLLQPDRNLLRTRCSDALDHREKVGGCADLLLALNRGDDTLGRHDRAVVEVHVLTRREHVGAPVGRNAHVSVT